MSALYWFLADVVLSVCYWSIVISEWLGDLSETLMDKAGSENV